MILTGSEDLRVRKTITNIHQAFADLIRTGDYGKITVTKLCAQALINKKTFYNYYDSIDALLAEMQEMLLREYLDSISGLKVPDDLQEINRRFFLYSANKGEVYEKIMCCEAYSFVSKNISQSFVHSAWQNFVQPQPTGGEEEKLLLCFLQTTGLELYRHWVRSGKRLPLEAVITLSGALLCSGVNGFIEAIKKQRVSPAAVK